MKTKTLHAEPEKRVYLSIITEYDLKRSVCELIDNAIDLWTKNKKRKLVLRILLDEQEKTIAIQDNAGGIEESNLDHIISPGKTSNDVRDEVIGYFGVGSKRAVVALAKDITIHSRFKNAKSFTVKFDDNWINENPSWDLPYSESTKPVPPFTTRIELSRLRLALDSNEIAELETHLSEVYCNFIDLGVEIWVNQNLLSGRRFDDEWSYPHEFRPIRLVSEVPVEGQTLDDEPTALPRNIKVEIVSGLIDHPGDPDDSYGVFLYCNDRLIARALHDFSVGFISGMVGNPHYNISLVRTIVKLRGESRDMPWDSSKSGINLKHEVFRSLRPSVIEITKRFAQISRSLQGTWETTVFPYDAGKIANAPWDSITTIPKSYLPTPPASKKKWSQKLLEKNAKITKTKPWASGLLDSIVAVDLIQKQPLEQKNRICLILLDSTLEIAYKEYLVHEQDIGMKKFSQIVTNRTDIQNEVVKNIAIDNETIKKIGYFYKLRNDLIHVRATPNVTDAQVEDYRNIVEGVLSDMFGFRFI